MAPSSEADANAVANELCGQAAAEGGHLSLIEQLLDEHAEVDAFLGRRYGLPLQAVAAGRPHCGGRMSAPRECGCQCCVHRALEEQHHSQQRKEATLQWLNGCSKRPLQIPIEERHCGRHCGRQREAGHLALVERLFQEKLI